MEILEFKGTKGEWHQSHRICDSEGNYSTQVYCDKGETIATLSWYPNREIKGVVSTYREANAKLIASAPELLYALQLILESKNNMKHYMSFDSSLMEAIDLGEKAIEKALK